MTCVVLLAKLNFYQRKKKKNSHNIDVLKKVRKNLNI